MKVTLTKSAAEELNKKVGNQKEYLKIQYETNRLYSGSGIATLLFVSSKDDTEDVLFETSYRQSYWMEKSQMSHFDDDLTNDYSDSDNSFQLRSPQQIINGRMSFIM